MQDNQGVEVGNAAENMQAIKQSLTVTKDGGCPLSTHASDRKQRSHSATTYTTKHDKDCTNKQQSAQASSLQTRHNRRAHKPRIYRQCTDMYRHVQTNKQTCRGNIQTYTDIYRHARAVLQSLVIVIELREVTGHALPGSDLHDGLMGQTGHIIQGTGHPLPVGEVESGEGLARGVLSQ